MKTQLLGIRLDNEVLTYLSENITNNVRQIEGALKRRARRASSPASRFPRRWPPTC